MTEAFKQGFVDTMQKIAASTVYVEPKKYRPEQLGLQADVFIPGHGPVRPSLPSYPSYESYLINKDKPIIRHGGRVYAYEGNISDLAKTMNDSGASVPTSEYVPIPDKYKLTPDTELHAYTKATQSVPAVKPRKTPYERRMAPGVASRSAG